MIIWVSRITPLLLLSSLLYIYFPHQSSIRTVDDHTKELSEPLNRILKVFNSSTYGDFDPAQDRWLDIQGFRKGDAYAWDQILLVKQQAIKHFRSAHGREDETLLLDVPPKDAAARPSPNPPLYQNLTGYVRGLWSQDQIKHFENRSNEHKSVGSIAFRGNISGSLGDVHIDIVESGQPDISYGTSARGIRVEITIYQRSPEISWTFKLHGQHMLETGTVVLATSSKDFQGLAALPHLAYSERHFDAIKNRLNRTLPQFLEAQFEWENITASESPETFQFADCEMLAYLQQEPVKFAPNVFDTINDLEQEFRYPMGRTKGPTPKLKMNMVLFSPNCGYVISTSTSDGTLDTCLIGEKVEARQRRTQLHIALLVVVVSIQLYFMVRQMKFASTPSMRDRVSYYTMFIMVVGDGQIYVALCCVSTLSESAFTMFSAATFMSALGCMAFAADFLRNIDEVQYQVSSNRRRTMLPPNSSTAESAVPIITAGGADILPTATRSEPMQPSFTSATPVGGAELVFTEARPSQFDTDQQHARTMSVFVVFSLVLFFCLNLYALTWRRAARQRYLDVACFIYLSLWVPQIYRNVMRNCRKALTTEFLLGQSFTRIGLVLYAYIYHDNLLFLQPNRAKTVLLVTWMLFQIAVLRAQEVFGPSLVVPKAWLPSAYDYHPVFRDDDESHQSLLGHSSHSPTSSNPFTESKHERLGRVFDCAICMQDVGVPIMHHSAWGTERLRSREYMVTPCRHVFHAKCLEAAMKYRLQCPVCRESLPPM